MSSGPNTFLVHSGFLVYFLRTSSLTTSLHSKIRSHLMTGDWGTTHKLKPRSFNKSYSTPILFTFRWSLLLEFILLLSNIILWYSTLLRSRVYSYLLLHSSVLWNSVLNIPLDFLHYLYNYYMVCALFSHTHHVTYHVMWHCDFLSCDYDYVIFVTWYFPVFFPV